MSEENHEKNDSTQELPESSQFSDKEDDIIDVTPQIVRMKAQKKEAKLHPEILELCPNGNTMCQICRLPAEEIKKIHKFYFDEGWSYGRLITYLKETYYIGKDKTLVSMHFSTHTKEEDRRKRPMMAAKQALATEKEERTALVKAITDEVSISTTKKAAQDIDNSFLKLAKLATHFVDTLDQISKSISVDPKKIEKSFDENPFKATAQFSALLKDMKELLVGIDSLRKPKAMVAKFYEVALDEAINSMGKVLADACWMIRDRIFERLEANKDITEDMLGDLFREIGEKYRDSMLEFKRTQMNKLSKTLSEVEKVI